MASLLQATRLRAAIYQPGAPQLRKVAQPVQALRPPWAKLTVVRNKIPSLASVAAGAVVEAAPTAAPPPSPTGNGPAIHRPTLYLLHRHLPRSADTHEGSVSQERLHQLHDDLKVMEKVAKRAAWFSTIEGSDGEHVLLLTDCAKLGRKYELQAMPVDGSSFTLDLPGGRNVLVPLAEVAAALTQQKAEDEASSESDEDDEEGMVSEQKTGMQVAAANAVAVCDREAEKAAKKRRKEEEKAAKALIKEAKKKAKALAKEAAESVMEKMDEEKSDDDEKAEEKEKMTAEKKAEKEIKKEREEEEDNSGSSGTESNENDSDDGSEAEEKEKALQAVVGANMPQQEKEKEKEDELEGSSSSSSDSESESEESSSESGEEEEGMEDGEKGKGMAATEAPESKAVVDVADA